MSPLHASRHLNKYLSDTIVRDLNTSTTVQAELENEWEQLVQDRKDAREIFRTGNSKVISPPFMQVNFICHQSTFN